MNLPDYFLVDIPPEAVVTPVMISEACDTLRHNRDQYLAPRSTSQLVRFFCNLGQNWLNPVYPFREEALKLDPAVTGFPSTTLVRGLDAFFEQFTEENFHRWLQQEFGNPHRLDDLVASQSEEHTQRCSIAQGPQLMAHITASNLPVSAFMSICTGILLRSAQFVKCASGTEPLMRLFAHSIYDMEPKLGACLEIASWKGGQTALEEMLFQNVDLMTASGSDESLADIRRRLPTGTGLIRYGHRLSFGFVSHKAMNSLGSKSLIKQAVDDVVAWNQMGCLSPHVFYVEKGPTNNAELFAEQLAAELELREKTEPRGSVSVEVSAAIARRRSLYELRAAHIPGSRNWFSAGTTAWSVVYEEDPLFQISCLNRFIYVKMVRDLDEALKGADAVRKKISTVGIAVSDSEAKTVAIQLARWGAPRICPLGRMQCPPLQWRHDGLPALASLITWSDWEKSSE